MTEKKPIHIPFNPPSIGDTTPKLELEVLNPPGDSSLLLGMAKVGDAIWVVGGLGYDTVLSSKDGQIESRIDGRGLRIIRSHGDDVWVCGEWGFVARSSDGGESWMQVPTNVNNCCWSIVIDEDGGVWGTADNGWVGYCTDGETWEGVQRGVSCTDTETWRNEYGMPGGIAWAEASALGVLLPADKRLLIGNRGTVEVSALESEEKLSHAITTPGGALVAVGHFGGIYRSDDGSSFDRIEGPTIHKRPAAKKGRPPMERQTHLHRVCAFDDGRLVATGDRGLIIVSGDDGRSWTKVSVDWGDDPPSDERTYALGVVDGTMLLGMGDGAIVGAR